MESVHPSLQPVSPSDCALAIAIPLSREQFLADLARPEEKDFVHHFRREAGLLKADAEFCWEAYQDAEAILAEAVCGETERHGVTVCHAARLADLTALLQRFPVVTLLTHWRFVPVNPNDVTDAGRLLESLRSPRTDVEQAIRCTFELLDADLLRPEVTAKIRPETLAQRAADVVSAVVNEVERFYLDGAASRDLSLEQMPDGLRDRLTRWEFEQAFPDCIAPAPMIEFAEGLRTLPQLIEAVPRDFRGVLDLTVCNSVIAANSIRHVRPDCLVAANRKPAVLRVRLYLYGLVVKLLSKQPRPYIEAVTQIRTGRSVYKANEGKSWNLFKKFFGSSPNR
jgi:hypothetical protein